MRRFPPYCNPGSKPNLQLTEYKRLMTGQSLQKRKNLHRNDGKHCPGWPRPAKPFPTAPDQELILHAPPRCVAASKSDSIPQTGRFARWSTRLRLNSPQAQLAAGSTCRRPHAQRSDSHPQSARLLPAGGRTPQLDTRAPPKAPSAGPQHCVLRQITQSPRSPRRSSETCAPKPCSSYRFATRNRAGAHTDCTKGRLSKEKRPPLQPTGAAALHRCRRHGTPATPAPLPANGPPAQHSRGHPEPHSPEND